MGTKGCKGVCSRGIGSRSSRASVCKHQWHSLAGQTIKRM